MPNLSCQVCGKILQFNQKKYCSRACYYKVIKCKSYKCSYCGKEIHRRPSSVKRANYNVFCSPECHSNSRKGTIYKHRKGKELICQNCGKHYYVVFSSLKKSKYCSHKCSRIGSRRKVKSECLVCKKEFNHVPSSHRTHCSRKCAGIALRTSIETKCPVCGKTFKYVPSNPRIYCSRKCSFKSCGISKLEQRIQQILPDRCKYTGLGDYWVIFQDGKRKNPDFVLAKKNGNLPKKVTKVIEIHGNYWHQDEWNNRGQDLIDRYKQVGIDCLVLWGSEIEKDFGQVMKKVSGFLNVEIRQLRLF